MNLLEREKTNEQREDQSSEIQALKAQIQKQQDLIQDQTEAANKQKTEIAKLKDTIAQCKCNRSKLESENARKVSSRNTIIFIMAAYILILTISMIITYRDSFFNVPEIYQGYWEWICSFVEKKTLHPKSDAESYYYLLSIPLLIIILIYFSYGAIKIKIQRRSEMIDYFKRTGQFKYFVGMTISLCSGSWLLAAITVSMIPDFISIIGWWILYSVILNSIFHKLSYLR